MTGNNSLNWQDFFNPFDKLPENIARETKNYERGLATGREATMFHIAANGVWSTQTKTGGRVFSYEKIGYHAGTAHFLRGVLESGVEIMDHRKPADAIRLIRHLIETGVESEKIPDWIMAQCAYPVRIDEGDRVYLDDFAVIDLNTGNFIVD